MRSGLTVFKGHAYGNDFLMSPEGDVQDRDLPLLARAMCDRQQGIGADGLLIYAWEGSGLRMRLFNADGSPSEVSGNGIRCLAALAVRERPGTTEVTVVTPAGLKVLELQSAIGDVLTFRASMGVPQDIRAVEFEAAGEKVQAVALSVGNPQCVLLDDPLLESRVRTLGPAIEHHPKFPDRTNVSFARVEAPNRVRILIWERGVGPTQASGTGGVRRGGSRRDIRWRVSRCVRDFARRSAARRVREDGIYLTGSAQLLFEGRWLPD